MSRKTFYLLVLLSLLSLVVGAPGTFAQTPQPPERPYPPESERPVHYPERKAGGGEEPLHFPKQESNAQSLSPAVALGEPGTSFRYVETFGVTGEPYSADGEHLFTPSGLFIDSGDNLYVVEEIGYRMLKFDSSGVNQLIIGHAGQPWHHDDFLANPRDVALSSNGHIWIVINTAIKEFDETGQLVQIFPETDPWNPGTDNDRFNDPRGIAFDSTGKLYVSDSYNHRIQVYDVSGESPLYLTTIGETGVPKGDNTGFNYPSRIAFDSAGRLYVLDSWNYRVQRCEFAGAWTCSTFFGETGVPGDDLFHLSYGWGINIKGDYVFLADGGNNRVLRCDTSGVCEHFAGTTGESGWDNDHFLWPVAVAIDSAGNVYVSDQDNHRIQKFDSSGTYLSTLGVTRVPYVTDDVRLNTPWGIGVTPDGSLYITEHQGFRLVKMVADGTQQWTVGEPYVYDADNAHIGWPSGNVAIDARGWVYVPDPGHNRVQIYNADGDYVVTLGSGGNGDYEFECPAGVAISPVNGDIYVVDRCNQRIQVFSSDRIYKATLGVLDETGSDNRHFNWPWGVAVDAKGKIYVADSDNQRVQKCTLSGSSYTCTTFAGETGVFDNAFGHLHPLSVAVDADGRVYVADEWNVRIQVFDKQGAYLTTIGGGWGQNTGEMVAPAGVAVDGEGNVYVTDRDNHRIQKFALGVPGWRQTNIDGFGAPGVQVSTLDVFQGQLYAGTWPGQVWRAADGRSWSQFTPPWSSSGVSDAQPFGSYLYLGTSGDMGNDVWVGEIWRTDGTSWEQVAAEGMGDINNYEVNVLAVFSDYLYAATSNAATGVEIWRSASGDAGSWTQVNNDGFGGGSAWPATMDIFGGRLYVGIVRDNVAELWRTQNGTDWTPVFTDGLAENNTDVSAMAEFQGEFYIGLRNVVSGGEVWRSSDGLNWTPMFTGGLGKAANGRPYGLIVHGNYLYLVFSNDETGAEVWRSADGATWRPVMQGGWGDSNNWYADYFDKAAAEFQGQLYIGTLNWVNGGDIWMKLGDIYLPVIGK